MYHINLNNAIIIFTKNNVQIMRRLIIFDASVRGKILKLISKLKIFFVDENQAQRKLSSKQPQQHESCSSIQ